MIIQDKLDKLNFYNNDGVKTLLSNIDGFFTCKVDEDLFLSKGDVIEVSGEREVYRVVSCEELNDRADIDYYEERKYDGFLNVKMMRVLDLTDLSVERLKAYNLKYDEDLCTKANYEILGIPVVVDGRLNKNQTVRYGSNVIVIQDLIKPDKKGGLTRVEGIELSREVVDSVYRVYNRDSNKILNIVGEFECWGDAIKCSGYYNSLKQGRYFL